MAQFVWALAACGLLLAGSAFARPYGVEDLLNLQSWGPVQLDPTERWLVTARSGPWLTSLRFDREQESSQATSVLEVFDLSGSAASPHLRLASAKEGYLPGPFSPDGKWLVVVRVSAESHEVGLVEMATGATRWTGRDYQPSGWGRSLQWRSSDQLLMVTPLHDGPHRQADLGRKVQRQLPQLWEASAQGRLGVSVLGAGRYRSLSGAPPPSELIAIDVRSGRSRRLATGVFSDMERSTSGRFAALVVVGEPLGAISQQPLSSGAMDDHRALVIVDLQTGRRSEPCRSCDLSGQVLSWSPAGDELLFSSQSQGQANGAVRLRLWSGRGGLDETQTLAVTPAIGKEPNQIPLVQAGWLGSSIMVLAQDPVEASRRHWVRLRSKAGILGPPQMLALQGRLEQTGPDRAYFSEASGRWRLLESGRLQKVKRLSEPCEPGGHDLDGLRPHLGPATIKERGEGRGRSFPWPPATAAGDARWEMTQTLACGGRTGVIAALRRDRHGVSQLWLHRPHHGPVSLGELNPGLEQVEPARVVGLASGAGSKAGLKSFVFLPPEPADAGPAPVVVMPYLGAVYGDAPSSARPDALSFAANVQVVVGAGYAVVVPSLPRLPDQDPETDLAERILAPVDQAARLGLIDPKRVALWGQSYGGWSVLEAATQSRRFSAVIASSAMTNMFSFYGRIPPQFTIDGDPPPPLAALFGWAEAGQGGLLAPPWRTPDRYLRRSPALRADRICAPVMLIQGDMDGDLSQAQTMFMGLARQSKDVVLLTYRGESHVVLSPDNVRDLYGRALGFLRQTMTPGPTVAPSGALLGRASGSCPANGEPMPP